MIYFALTIDVEPDCSYNWKLSDPLSFAGVNTGIKERLQPLFNKYGIVPTYLVNNIVLEDEESVGVLKALKGKYELGTHLHPEFIEPGKSVFNYAASSMDADCCLYPADIEFRKIKNITDLFEKKFRTKPLSFRAGRFAAGKNTFEALTSLGYKVDSSVTPHICWNDRTHKKPIDHSNACNKAYWINDSLLEVPISIIKSYFKKILWLRPTLLNYNQLRKVFSAVVASQRGCQDLILNMMFHNVEVVPKASPYTKTEDDCKKYLEKLEKFFIFCGQKDVTSVNLSSLCEVIKKDMRE